jgi:hypothetical protein
VTFTANEATKESHVKNNDLVGLNGLPVKTKSVETYAKLFELPKFDIATLAQIKQLTLKMHDGLQATLAVTKVTKEAGSTVAKFYTATQDIVTVDGDSHIVMASVDGKCHTVDVTAGDVAMARRLRSTEAKLYDAEEFFALPDFVGGSRKLADTSKMTGFASVALAATEAVLDVAKANNYITDETMGFEGDVRAESGMCSPIMEVKTWVDSKNDQSKVDAIMENSRVITHMLSKTQGTEFKYTRATEADEWILKSCDALEFSDVAAEGPAQLTAVKAQVVAHHGAEFVVKADKKLFVGKAIFGAKSDDLIVVPKAAECKKLYDEKATTFDPSDDAVRRLGGAPRKLGLKTNSQLWWASQCAYKGKCGRTGTECSASNANAKTMTIGGKSVIAFAGTDGLSDIGDWLDNLDIRSTTVNGLKLHKGFERYQSKVAASCSTMYNAKYDYCVGHSLGGAAATVYAKVTGNCRNLVTFGAPKTRHNDQSGCSAVGTRVFHSSDPITSDGTHLLRILGGFKHDVKGARRVWKNTGSCKCGSTFGLCHRSGWWVNCGWRGCRSGYHCNDSGRHPDTKHSSGASCSQEGDRQNLISAGINFATVHTQYDQYIPDHESL